MKVLVLAYDFPPLISIGGQRPYSWYKYLPQNNIQVTVVTRQWKAQTAAPVDYVQPVSGTPVTENSAASKIVRTGFNPNLRDRLLIRFGFEKLTLLRKLLTFFYSFAEHLFFVFDSKASVYFEAYNQIKANRPDIIIATGEPFILFKYASILSRRFNIPWIADYRDSWTGNQGNYKLGTLQLLQNRFFRSRELKYISNASLITTAAPAYAASLQAIHPGKKIEVLYNGFDEDFFNGLDSIAPPADKFIISYAGTIYPHQNLEMFLDGLAIFISQNKIMPAQLQVNFYGLESQTGAKNRLMNYLKEVTPFLHIHGRLPYAELVKKLRASHLLLLLSRKGAGWLNAKVFDYLAVNRKTILVENDNDILQQILKSTNGGTALNNKDEVASLLKTEFELFKINSNTEAGVNKKAFWYTRKNQARKLSVLLDNILNNPAQ